MSPAPDPATTVPRGSIDMAALNLFLGSVNSAVGPELILSPGKDLFHYSDLNGLLGIVQNGDLWLTNSRYSNDEDEMAHGQRLAAEAIGAAMLQAQADAPRTLYLEQLITLVGKPSVEGVYICLSQWRGYGAYGAGVSIQFDSALLAPWTGAHPRCAPSVPPTPSSVRCDLGPSKVKALNVATSACSSTATDIPR